MFHDVSGIFLAVMIFIPVNITVENDEFAILFLLYDPTHLLKNIRNNWHTEKMQKLKFTSPENAVSVIAQWKDLFKIYKLEEHCNKVNKIGLRHIVSL